MDEATDKFIFYLLGNPSYYLLLHVDIVKLLTTTTYFYRDPPYLLVCEDTLLMPRGRFHLDAKEIYWAMIRE